MKENLPMYIFLVVMVSMLLAVVDKHFRDYDNTDDVKNKVRSGMILYTDYGTGNQYVKGGLFGSITPRLNSDGTVYNIYVRRGQ